jgi:hypothetical protein
MSAAEIAWRARTVSIQQSWRSTRPTGPAAGAIAWTGANLPAVDVDPRGKQRVLRAAEAILAGTLGRVRPQLRHGRGRPPTGIATSAPAFASDPSRYCFAVPYRDPRQVGTSSMSGSRRASIT